MATPHEIFDLSGFDGGKLMGAARSLRGLKQCGVIDLPQQKLLVVGQTRRVVRRWRIVIVPGIVTPDKTWRGNLRIAVSPFP